MIGYGYNLPWALRYIDLSSFHANGPITEDDILALLTGNTEDGVNRIQSKIERAICFNEGLWDIAAPVVDIILSTLANVNPLAKEACLDLLSIIVYSEPVDKTSNVKEQCLNSMLHSLWYFLHDFQFGPKRYSTYYHAILSALGENYPEIESRVEFYLNQYQIINGINPIDAL